MWERIEDERGVGWLHRSGRLRWYERNIYLLQLRVSTCLLDSLLDWNLSRGWIGGSKREVGTCECGKA